MAVELFRGLDIVGALEAGRRAREARLREERQGKLFELQLKDREDRRKKAESEAKLKGALDNAARAQIFQRREQEAKRYGITPEEIPLTEAEQLMVEHAPQLKLKEIQQSDLAKVNERKQAIDESKKLLDIQKAQGDVTKQQRIGFLQGIVSDPNASPQAKRRAAQVLKTGFGVGAGPTINVNSGTGQIAGMSDRAIESRFQLEPDERKKWRDLAFKGANLATKGARLLDQNIREIFGATGTLENLYSRGVEAFGGETEFGIKRQRFMNRFLPLANEVVKLANQGEAVRSDDFARLKEATADPQGYFSSPLRIAEAVTSFVRLGAEVKGNAETVLEHNSIRPLLRKADIAIQGALNPKVRAARAAIRKQYPDITDEQLDEMTKRYAGGAK